MEELEIKKLLGLRIKSFRKENNLSQNDLCDIIDREQNNLSNIENGKTFPDITTLCLLIEKAKIEPNFLLGFLFKGQHNYKNIDFEIIELISNLSNDTKKHLKNFLKSLK